MILHNGFFSPPLQYVDDSDTGRLRVLEALEYVQGSYFLTVFQNIAIQLPIPTTFEMLLYDFARPTVQDDVKSGRRMCKVWVVFRINCGCKQPLPYYSFTQHAILFGQRFCRWRPEKVEVPIGVPNEMPCTATFDKMPIVTNWAVWFDNQSW